ncbi:hypothetical protein [Salinarimonas sp.]|uniref:hypothetical protein n=1 Tax=Salinarimonas sp. TaxID=2766526 RepID=UPI0032D930CC
MTTLVTEGILDERLWRALLRATRQDGVRVLSAGGRSAAVSKANTILVLRDEPVALVLDADTSDRRLLENETATARFALQLGADDVPAEAFLIVPATEALYLSDDAFIAQMLGRPLTEVQRVRAEYEPQRVIRELLGADGVRRLVERLEADAQAAERIARSDAAAPVLAFIESSRAWERATEAITG